MHRQNFCLFFVYLLLVFTLFPIFLIHQGQFIEFPNIWITIYNALAICCKHITYIIIILCTVIHIIFLWSMLKPSRIVIITYFIEEPTEHLNYYNYRHQHPLYKNMFWTITSSIRMILNNSTSLTMEFYYLGSL